MRHAPRRSQRHRSGARDACRCVRSCRPASSRRDAPRRPREARATAPSTARPGHAPPVPAEAWRRPDARISLPPQGRRVGSARHRAWARDVAAPDAASSRVDPRSARRSPRASRRRPNRRVPHGGSPVLPCPRRDRSRHVDDRRRASPAESEPLPAAPRPEEPPDGARRQDRRTRSLLAASRVPARPPRASQPGEWVALPGR